MENQIDLLLADTDPAEFDPTKIICNICGEEGQHVCILKHNPKDRMAAMLDQRLTAIDRSLHSIDSSLHGIQVAIRTVVHEAMAKYELGDEHKLPPVVVDCSRPDEYQKVFDPPAEPPRPSLKAKLEEVRLKRLAIKQEAQKRVACAWTISKTMLPHAPPEQQKTFAANLLQNDTRTLASVLRQTAKNAHATKAMEEIRIKFF
jgi:hypothetical protein